jgi:hypothetical protein
MPTAVRRIHVNVPTEQVWDFLQTPGSIVEWWPDCVEIHDVTRRGDGEVTFGWTDKPAAVTCHGEIVETVEVPGKSLVLHLVGDLCGDLHWRISSENGGTDLVFESDYDLPVRALLPFLSPFRILTFQQDEADKIAEKIREHFDHESSRR